MWVKVNLVIFLFGFSSAYKFGVFSTSYKVKALSNATYYIKENHFAQRGTSLTITGEVADRQAQYEFDDFSDQFFNPILSVKVQLTGMGKHHPKSWDNYNILYVDSATSFRIINPGEKSKNQDITEYYLVVYNPLRSEHFFQEMEAIFAYCWRYDIINVSIMMVDAESKVQLFTYFPFNVEKCFSTTPVKLEGFEFKDIFPSKTQNFHQCTLTGVLWENPPYLIINDFKNGNVRFGGLEGQILTQLSKQMNFSIKQVLPPDDTQGGLIFPNGTVTGAIKLLKERQAHFSLSCFRLTWERSILLTASTSFYQTDQIYFVKANTQHWTTFEIMTYPFDDNIWMILLTLMATAVVLSSCLEKFHTKSCYFIFGSGNTGNFLSIIGGWLGYPVIPEPRRNFARFILTLWLVAALVLRNSYQGILYTFLTSNFAKNPPETDKDLAEQDYNLLITVSTNDTLSEIPIIQSGQLKVEAKNVAEAEIYEIFEDTNGKVASCIPKDFLSYYVMKKKKHGMFHILKERTFTHQICAYFPKHSFLMPRFNKIFLQLRSFGIIDYWASKNTDNVFIKLQTSEPTGGVPLTLKQLDGAFLMMIYCFAATVVVFIGEILFKKFNVF